MVQFTKLKLSGFKSFLYPTEIEIGRGKTGVVGPNGCGKSNLLEALGWVMGETSAKRLRGSGMDDVIFNGTKTKAARTTAEVTLTLDNADKSAPPPYQNLDTLEVTRRIERGVGSDYFINGKSVRAKDVQLLFADLVSGANSPALVSQGRITAIIQAKPKDRRRILEDAAGISGLHARRHEAELKLKATSANLERLEDVVGTMETQLNGLKKQARQATRYRNISEQIKALEAVLAVIKWSKVKTERSKVKSEYDALEAQVRDKLALTTQLNTKKADLAATVPDLRKAEATKAAILQRFIIEKENLELEQNRLSESLAKLNADIERTAQDLAFEKDTITESKTRLDDLEGELKNATSGNETDAKQRQSLETQINDHIQTLRTTEESVQTLGHKIATMEAERNSLQNQKIGLEGQIANLSEEKKKYEERLEVIVSKIKEQTLFDSLQKDIEDKEKQLLSIKEQRDTLDEEKTHNDIALSNARASYQTAQSALSKIEAEIDALESILQNGMSDEHTPVLEQLDVQDGYEKALASALDETLNNPVVKDALIYWSDLGAQPIAQNLPAGVKALNEFVKAPAQLSRILSQVGLVETAAMGEEKATHLLPGQILVTKDGEFWRWDGLTAQSDAPNTAAIRLQQKNRLNELKQDINKAQQRVDNEKEVITTIEAKIADVVETIKGNRTTLQTLETEVREARSKLGSLEKELSQLSLDRTSLETSLERIDDNITQARGQLDGVLKTIKGNGSLDDLRLEHTGLNEQLHKERGRLSSLRNELNDIVRQSDRREERQKQITREKDDLTRRIERATQREQELSTRIETLNNELNQIKQSPEGKDERKSELMNHIEAAEKERNIAAEALAVQENQIRDVETNLRIEENALADMREKRALTLGNLQNLERQAEEIQQAVFDSFEIQPDHLNERLELGLDETNMPSLNDTENKLSRLHLERENMGPVNLRAEIEAEEIETEMEKLGKEQYELISAINKLRHAIGRLNGEARERLMTAFGEVDAHFRTLFEQLFGGGKAYLQLTESDDPLDAGLEIFAQPPGKKLQNLTLLSGGEQTLTSIALVFAMFLTNPSPICVLDEIDAALDDANVDRVCNLLDKMAAKGDTRFLVISHHRMSIARMDRLYGVTMAERGISQLVSVDLSQGDLLETIAA